MIPPFKKTLALAGLALVALGGCTSATAEPPAPEPIPSIPSVAPTPSSPVAASWEFQITGCVMVDAPFGPGYSTGYLEDRAGQRWTVAISSPDSSPDAVIYALPSAEGQATEIGRGSRQDNSWQWGADATWRGPAVEEAVSSVSNCLELAEMSPGAVSSANWRDAWAGLDWDAINAMPDTIHGPDGSDPRCDRPTDAAIRGIAEARREAPNPPDWPQKVARVVAFVRNEPMGLADAGPRWVIAAETNGVVSLWGASDGAVFPLESQALAWTPDERRAGRDAADVAASCLRAVP